MYGRCFLDAPPLLLEGGAPESDESVVDSEDEDDEDDDDDDDDDDEDDEEDEEDEEDELVDSERFLFLSTIRSL